MITRKRTKKQNKKKPAEEGTKKKRMKKSTKTGEGSTDEGISNSSFNCSPRPPLKTYRKDKDGFFFDITIRLSPRKKWDRGSTRAVVWNAPGTWIPLPPRVDLQDRKKRSRCHLYGQWRSS